jgi:hypothetical protein
MANQSLSTIGTRTALGKQVNRAINDREAQMVAPTFRRGYILKLSKTAEKANGDLYRFDIQMIKLNGERGRILYNIPLDISSLSAVETATPEELAKGNGATPTHVTLKYLGDKAKTATATLSREIGISRSQLIETTGQAKQVAIKGKSYASPGPGMG